MSCEVCLWGTFPRCPCCTPEAARCERCDVLLEDWNARRFWDEMETVEEGYENKPARLCDLHHPEKKEDHCARCDDPLDAEGPCCRHCGSCRECDTYVPEGTDVHDLCEPCYGKFSRRVTREMDEVLAERRAA